MTHTIPMSHHLHALDAQAASYAALLQQIEEHEATIALLNAEIQLILRLNKDPSQRLKGKV